MTKLTINKQDKNINVEVLAPVINDYARNNIYLAHLICNAFGKEIGNSGMGIETSLSVFNLPVANLDLNIIDCKINGLKVAFVPTVNKASNKCVYIPMSYRDYKYTPDVMIFVNFSKTLAKLEILGFLSNPDISLTSIEKSELESPEKLEKCLKTQKPSYNEVSSASINTAEELMLAYIDGDLSAEGVRFFQKYLLLSDVLRKNYKMFYALNCDFVCIANDTEIEKKIIAVQPAASAPEKLDFDMPANTADLEDFSLGALTFSIEEEVQNEIQEDMAASSQEEPLVEENIPDTDLQIEEGPYEGINEEAVVEEQPLSFEDENIIDEEQLLTLEDDYLGETLHEDIEVTPLDEISPFDITEELSDSDIESLTPLDITDNLEEETLEENENLLDFSTVDDLVLSEEDSFDDEIIADNDVDLQEVTALDNQEQDNLQDLGIDEDLDFEADDLDLLEFDESTETTESEENSVEFIDETGQEIPTPQETITNQEDDDIFSMLSDLADKPVSPEALAQLDDEALGILMKEDEQFSHDASAQPHHKDEEAGAPEPLEEKPVQTKAASESTEYVSAYIPQETHPQPKKANLVTLLIFGALLLGMVAYAGLMYKDEIVMLVNPGASVENLEPEKTQPETTTAENNPLPQPVEANQEQRLAQETNQAQVPPPPSAVKPSGDLPPAAVAPQVPIAANTAVKAPKPRNINDAIATAMTKEYSAVRISKTAWEAPEALVANAEFKKYLTLTGRSIKTTLSQELLLANEKVPDNEISVAITYSNLGSVIGTKIIKSSGSKQVDDIVINSINETLNYTKMPALKINKKEYTIRLLITL